jgi:hypothetical protein
MLYTLMHKTIEIAQIEIDDDTHVILRVLEVYHTEHLPVGVLRDEQTLSRQYLNDWWIGRTIPHNRRGLRDALWLMHVPSTLFLLYKCFGLSLSDQYWVRPTNSSLRWEDINFFENDFSEDVGNALFGRNVGGGGVNLMSPDNTSDGWLKKKWVIADGKRFLLKSGSLPAYQEPFNEVLASIIMDRLKISHIPYRLTWNGEEPPLYVRGLYHYGD